MADIKLKQYSYIAVTSQMLSCAEIEERLEMPADEHKVLGIKRHEIDPSFAVINAWKLIDMQNSRVDEQVERLLARILPVQEALAGLVSEHAVEVELQIVRYFDHEHGETEETDDAGEFVKLSGQHQLIGWHLEKETLAFLASVGAEIDVDEYN